jgi:TonB family protein
MNTQRLLALISLVFGLGNVHAERREFTYSVAAEIDTNGHVASADLKAQDVDEAFASTIEGLVKQWRFRPAMANGAPAVAATTLTTQVVVDLDKNNSATVTVRYLRHGAAPDGLQQPPRYPVDAMRSRASAEVAVMATVDADGRPTKVELHSLMMNIDDARLGKHFANQCMDAVRQWKFQPERVNGQPVASRVVVPIKFTVDKNAGRRWKWMVKPPEESQITIDFDQQQPVALGNATGLELVSDGSQG